MEGKQPVSEERIREIVTNFLISFPFFSKMNKEELNLVASYIDYYEIDEEKNLFNEGDDGDRIYFVVDGELDVLKESVSSHKTGIDRVIVATLSRGSSIGEMSIIDSVPRFATVKVRSKATLVSLSRDGFKTVIENHPKIGNKILIGLSRLLSKKLRQTSGRLADYTLTWSKAIEEAKQSQT